MNTTAQLLQELQEAIQEEREYYTSRLIKLEKENDELKQQIPKIGRWIGHRKHCEMNNLRPSGLGSYFWCSECDCGIDSKDFARVNYNYCPTCGTKMAGFQIP